MTLVALGQVSLWLWWPLAMMERLIANYKLVPLQTNDQSPAISN